MVGLLNNSEVPIPRAEDRQLLIAVQAGGDGVAQVNEGGPVVFDGVVPAAGVADDAASFGITVGDAGRACLTFKIAVVQDGPLYRFSEVRCFHVGGPMNPAACLPAEEWCNSYDDDCDGVVDNNSAGICGECVSSCGAGDGCADPRLVSPSVGSRELWISDTHGSPNAVGQACGLETPGPDRVYGFRLEHDLASSFFRLRGVDIDRMVLELRRGGDCADAQPFACDADLDLNGDSEFGVEVLPAGMYWLVVDTLNEDDEGTFILEQDFGRRLALEAADRCEDIRGEAVELPLTGEEIRFAARLREAEPDMPAPPCVAPDDDEPRRDVVFRYSLAADASVEIVAQTTGVGPVAVWDSVECGRDAAALQCMVASLQSSSSFAARRPAGVYHLIATGLRDDVVGVEIALRAVPGPARESPGETCDEAIPLHFNPWHLRRGEVHVVANGNTLSARDDHAGRCNDGAGEDVVFSVDLDTPSWVLGYVSPYGERRVSAHLTADCAEPGAEAPCLEEGWLLDHVLPAGRWFIVVDSPELRAGGAFQLGAWVLPHWRPGGQTCEDAVELAFDERRVARANGTTVNAADDLHAECGDGTPGRDVVYSFTLEAAVGRTRLELDTSGPDRHPGNSWDGVLALLRARCGEGDGVACNDDSPLAYRASEVIVDGLDAGRYLVVVDGYGDGDRGLYGLRIELGPVLAP